MSDRFGIGYGKYWDTTIEDDEYDLWVSVFSDRSFGHLVLSHETATVEWMEDWPRPKQRERPEMSNTERITDNKFCRYCPNKMACLDMGGCLKEIRKAAPALEGSK